MNWALILSDLFFVVGLGLAYWFLIRPQLQKRPALASFYVTANSFWAAVGMKLSGIRTKLTFISGLVVSALVELHDYALPFVTGVDWPMVVDKVPLWVWPLLGFVLSSIFGYLHKITDEKHAREIAAVAVGTSPAEAVTIAEVAATPTEAAQMAVKELA